MPGVLTKIELAPGLVKDETPLAAEGGCVDAGNVRFRQGKPETRGGWLAAASVPFTGMSRGQHGWSDLNGRPWAAWGTRANAYVFDGTTQTEITPPFAESAILNPFATSQGSPVVTVTIPEHGLTTSTPIIFSNATAVGGLTIDGSYTPTRIVTRDSFEINAGTGAASTVTTGGAGVDYLIPFPPGMPDGTSANNLISAWSLDNFGETLLLNRRGGPLFAWQPAASYPEILLDSKFVGGTGWVPKPRGGARDGVTSIASNLSQNIQNAVMPGAVYRMVAVVSGIISSGSLTLGINAGSPEPAVLTVGAASTIITKNGTYSRTFVMPANPVDFVLTASGGDAFSVNVSLKLESKAFQIAEAPRRIDSMFVDPHRTVCLFGTYEADGDYNPLLARWSDLENYRIWVPDTNNFAGEIAVASGGRIVRALATRGANLIWTDTGLHGMQFSTDGFAVALIATGCGAMGINAVVEHQGIAYWLASDGTPYRTAFDFQGAAPQRIDCRIKTDIDAIALYQQEKVFASVNTEFAEVQWFIPDGRIGTECNRAIVYQFMENHWTSWLEDRSSWMPAGAFPWPLACGTDGQLYWHERGTTANGADLLNYLVIAYFDIEDGGNLMQVMGIAHDFARRTGPVDFYIKTKPFANGPETMTGPYTATLTPAAGTYRDQKLDFRRTGRQMAIRMQSTSPWRLGTLRTYAKKSGAVR